MKTETRGIVLGALHRRRQDVATQIKSLIEEKEGIDAAIQEIGPGQVVGKRRIESESEPVTEPGPEPVSQPKPRSPRKSVKKRGKKSESATLAGSGENGKSKYRGVWWNSTMNRWQCKVIDSATDKPTTRSFREEDDAAQFIVDNNEELNTVEDILR